MRQLTESERAYRRGALQALEFILSDLDTSSKEATTKHLSHWLQCLRGGRTSTDVAFLGTYLDTVREHVNSCKLLDDKPGPEVDTVNSLQKLPGGEYIDPTRAIHVLYTNHKNRTAWRKVVPLNKLLRYDTTPHHPDKQWLMEVWDVNKQEYRTYALEGIHWIMSEEQYGEEPSENLEALRKQYEEMPDWRK